MGTGSSPVGRTAELRLGSKLFLYLEAWLAACYNAFGKGDDIDKSRDHNLLAQ